VSTADQTLDDPADSPAGAMERPPLLFVVLEADRLLSGGGRHSLGGVRTVTLGRGPAREGSRTGDGRILDIRLPGKWISSRHAVIRAVGNEWIAEDVGSRNGTFINGRRTSSGILRDGDVLEVGRVFLRVRGGPASAGAITRDEDAAVPLAPFGLRSLLPELEEDYVSLARVARRSALPILFLGATGSGKEVLAREMHAQSERPGAFVAVNCGALPRTLVESLLFGHVRGAFSGADRDETGFVRAADGGTLLLDEIGDLPASSQAALLRVLQEQEVVPVGSTRAIKVDVRIVSATHKPLPELIARGAFRADLLARLKGYTHRLLPLRERMADFGVLLADVLRDVAGAGASEITMTPEVARALLMYEWPHNIRELYQVMASTLALSSGRALEAHHLPAELRSSRLALAVAAALPESAADTAGADDLPLRDRLVVLLHEHRGNVTAVARAMGKAPTQIHRWTRRLGIDPDVYRGDRP
jgi:transcriptional regulator of acetoin/glycerol metabolism